MGTLEGMAMRSTASRDALHGKSVRSLDQEGGVQQVGMLESGGEPGRRVSELARSDLASRRGGEVEGDERDHADEQGQRHLDTAHRARVDALVNDGAAAACSRSLARVMEDRPTVGGSVIAPLTLFLAAAHGAARRLALLCHHPAGMERERKAERAIGRRGDRKKYEKRSEHRNRSVTEMRLSDGSVM